MKPRTERTDCHPDSGRPASSIILLRDDADRARESSRRKGGSTGGSRPKRPPVREGAIMTALVHLDPEPHVVVEGADGTEHVRVSNGAGSLYWHGRSYWLRWPVADTGSASREFWG